LGGLSGLAGLAAFSGERLLGLSGLALSSRAEARSGLRALDGLIYAIAPGAPGLPGAGPADADFVLARLSKLALAESARVQALLEEADKISVIGNADLERWRRVHPEALNRIAALTFASLYGSTRHGGRGESRAFSPLRYP